MKNGSLMKVESIAAFYNTFDLHQAIIGLEKHVFVFFRVADLHRFYCYFASYGTSKSLDELSISRVFNFRMHGIMEIEINLKKYFFSSTEYMHRRRKQLLCA